MAPCEGDRRFTSAINPTVASRSPGNGRTDGPAAARFSSSADLTRRAVTRERAAATIVFSETLCGLSDILAFGRFSGSLDLRQIFGSPQAGQAMPARDP